MALFLPLSTVDFQQTRPQIDWKLLNQVQFHHKGTLLKEVWPQGIGTKLFFMIFCSGK